MRLVRCFANSGPGIMVSVPGINPESEGVSDELGEVLDLDVGSLFVLQPVLKHIQAERTGSCRDLCP